MQFCAITFLTLHTLSLTRLLREPPDEDSILLIKSGTGMLHTDSARFPFAPESCFFLSRAASIRADFPQDVQVISIRVKLNYLDLHQSLYGTLLPLKDSAQLRRALANYQESDAHARAYLQEALEASLFHAAQIRLPDAAVPVSAKQDITAQLNAFIEAHLCESFSVPALASSIGYSPKLLNSFLKEQFGCTAMEYVNRYKISKSKMMLLSSSKSITDISYECGFQSLHYYSRFFKQMVGVSPQVFRQTGGLIQHTLKEDSQ